MLARKEAYGGIIWRPIGKPRFSIIRFEELNYSYNKTTYSLFYNSTLLKKCTGDRYMHLRFVCIVLLSCFVLCIGSSCVDQK